jgi:hypothetical protein
MLDGIGGAVASAARAAAQAAANTVKAAAKDFSKKVTTAQKDQGGGSPPASGGSSQQASGGGSQPASAGGPAAGNGQGAPQTNGVETVPALWIPPDNGAQTTKVVPAVYTEPADAGAGGPPVVLVDDQVPLGPPAPADTANPADPETGEPEPTFPELNDPVSKSLKGLLDEVRADNTTDPEKKKVNQVVEATLEFILHSKEAERLKTIADQKGQATQKAEKDYGTGSTQHVTALGEQKVAESAYAEELAKANEAKAQLDVYALDPAYKAAMGKAQTRVNGTLAKHELQFTMPTPSGTLADAKARLAQRKQATTLATQARQEYEKALQSLAQLPPGYVPGQQYQAPTGPSISAPGGEGEDTRNARNRAAHSENARIWAEAMLGISKGDKLIADSQVITLEQDLKLTKPGTKEHQIISDALGKAKTQQSQSATNLNNNQKFYNLKDAEAFRDGVLLEKQLIIDRAVADLAQRSPHLFQADGYTDGNNKYSGDFEKYETKIGKDGQLYIVIHYEHKTLEVQVTFAPGKRNRGSDTQKQLDQDWQELTTDPKRCIGNVFDYAHDRVAAASEGVIQPQIAELDAQIPQLRQDYLDALARHAPPPGSPPAGSPSAGWPPAGSPGGPPLHPEVAEAKTKLDEALALREQLGANLDWLGYLQTQSLTNLDNPMELERLRKEYFIADGDERQRLFKEANTEWGAPKTWDGARQREDNILLALGMAPTGQGREMVQDTSNAIAKFGGDKATVQAVPVFLAMDGGGLHKTALFVVTDSNGTQHIIDDIGRDYDDLDDYKEDHKLPTGGTLYMPENLRFTTDAAGDINIGQMKVEGDPLKGVDVGVGIVTSVATVASFTPAAPIAVPIAVAGGTYLGYRSAQRLADMREHGQSWASKQGVMELAMLVTSALPVGAGLIRTSGLVREGMTVTAATRTGFGSINYGKPMLAVDAAGRPQMVNAGRWVTPYAQDASLVMQQGGKLFTTAKVLDVGGMVIGAPLMAVSGYDLVKNWGQMAGLDKVNGFLGVVTGAYGTGRGARGLIYEHQARQAAKTAPQSPAAGQPGHPPVPAAPAHVPLGHRGGNGLAPGNNGTSPVAHGPGQGGAPGTVNAGAPSTVNAGSPRPVNGGAPVRGTDGASLASPLSMPLTSSRLFLDLGVPGIHLDGSETGPNGDTRRAPRVAMAAASEHGSETGAQMPVSSAQRLQLQRLIGDVDDQFLAAMAGYRRPQIRTASDAAYIVRPNVLNRNAAAYLPKGADPSEIVAYVAYSDGEARAIFVRDTLAHRAPDAQTPIVAHEIAHYYAHPDFVKLAMRLRVDPNDPLSNLGEGAAERLAHTIIGDGHDGEVTSLHYPEATQVVNAVAAKMGKEAFYQAFFQGDAAALRLFHSLALQTGKVTEVAGSSASATGNMPGFATSGPPPRQVTGDGYTGDHWPQFYSGLRGGATSPDTRYVYVVAAAPQKGVADFTASDILFYGTIPAKGRHIRWRGGTAPADVTANRVVDIFGAVPAGKEVRFVVSNEMPSSVLKTTGDMQFALHAPAPPPKAKPAPKVKAPVTPAPAPTGSPIAGDGYIGSTWNLFHKRVQGGQIAYPGERYVYIVEVPRGQGLVFNPADIRAAGRLQRGVGDIKWINSELGSTPARTITVNTGGKTVKDVFGAPAQGRVFKFFVSHLTPEQLTQATGPMSVNVNKALPLHPTVLAPRTVAAPKGKLPAPIANPDRSSPPNHEGRLLKGVAKAAQKWPTLDKVLGDLFPTGVTFQPTSLLVRQIDVIEYNNFIESIAHQAHEHPEGYDARLTPENPTKNPFILVGRPISRRIGPKVGALETRWWDARMSGATGATRPVSERLLHVRGQASGTPYTVRLALVRGPYSEVWIAGIPQGCGVPHYTGLDPRPPSYRGSAELDTRHINDYKQVLHNYSKWARHMDKVAQDYGPDVASRIDLLALQRDDAGLRGLLASEGINPRLAKQIDTLATTDKTRPHLALNMHVAITGFNPASKDSAFYLVDRFLDSYQLIAGMGETTLVKENIKKQQAAIDEDFDFSNPDHRTGIMTWLTIGKLFDKHTVIHSDNSIAPLQSDNNPSTSGKDGRLGRGITPYSERQKLVDLLGPFSVGGGLTHAHAGGGRSAALDNTLIPAVKADGSPIHPDINGLNYGPKISRQVHEMELMAQKHPEWLSDNSWNDNSFAVGSDDNLFRDYQIFARRHPNLVNGSDTVKPVNVSHARQHGTDDLPWKVALGVVDKKALLNVIRKNFEKTVHDGKLDSAALQKIAGNLDDLVARIQGGAKLSDPALEGIANAFIKETAGDPARRTEVETTLAALATKIRGAPPPKEYPVMDKVWHGDTRKDKGGNDVTIVRGREQMRQLAEEEFNKKDFEAARPKVESWGPVSPPRHPAITGDLPVAFTSGKAIIHDTTDTIQVGTSAGYPRVVQLSESARGVVSDLAPVVLGLGLGVVPLPAVGDVMTVLRQAGFKKLVNTMETERLRWENIHEEAQVTDDALSVYLAQVLKVGSEIGVDKGDLQEFALIVGQLRTDVAFIRNETKGWPASRKREVFDLLMSAVGNAQFRGDAQMGVQAASLSTTNARTKAGRTRSNLINATAATNIATGGWLTAKAAMNPDLANHVAWLISTSGASAAQTLASSFALGAMIGRNIVANRQGRKLANPEISSKYSGLQHKVLKGIQYSAGFGALYQGMMIAAPGGGWVQHATQGAISLLTMGVAKRAAHYEALRNANEGTQIPAQAARTTEWVLAMLTAGATAGLAIELFGDDIGDKKNAAVGNFNTTKTKMEGAKQTLDDTIEILKQKEAALTTAQGALDTAETELKSADTKRSQLPANATPQEKQEAQTAYNEALDKRNKARDARNTAKTERDAAIRNRDEAQGKFDTANDAHGRAKKELDMAEAAYKVLTPSSWF